MNQIWKYSLSIGDNDISMPAEAKILCVQMQRGQPKLWALGAVDNPRRYRRIEVLGTGHEMDNSRRVYIGTIQLSEGALVFHIFEALPEGKTV